MSPRRISDPVSDAMTGPFPRVGALAVVIEAGEVLLVCRPPGKPGPGLWGFPGGHLEPGETIHAAAARELLEETGLRADPVETLLHLDVIGHGTDGALLYHYLLVAVRCTDPRGTLVAADDACAAEWVPVADVLSGRRAGLFKDVATVLRRAQDLSRPRT